MIQISNDPKRKYEDSVVLRYVTPISKVELNGRSIVMTTKVHYFIEKEIESVLTEVNITDEFANKEVQLIVDNTTPVVIATGAYATGNEAPNEVQGEYDWIRTQKLYSIAEMENLSVLRADGYGRFN